MTAVRKVADQLKHSDAEYLRRRPSSDERVEATAAALRAAADEARMLVTGDGRIGEADAAALIGCEPETLAKKRQEGRAPPSYRLPVGPARVSYRITDIAAHIEAAREDF